MRRTTWAGYVGLTVAIVLGLLFLFPANKSHVLANGAGPLGPDRFGIAIVDYTAYEWWLIGWSDNYVACQIFIEHTGMPTHEEIYNACGEILYNAWAATKPCDEAAEGGNVLDCHGYYLHEYGSGPAQKKVSVELPPAMVWVTLEGCAYGGLTNTCSDLPTIILTGEEPLSGERITGIVVNMNGEQFACDPVCRLEMGPTGEEGVGLFFWASSSYGDTSEVFEARVRVVQTWSSNATGPSWYVDVLSSQWRGFPAAGCADAWDLFAPVGGPPRWLSTPDHPEEMASDVPYDYLAGYLITKGVIDASHCPGEGLLPSGAATKCGIEAATPAMIDWQNRFDALIYSAAWDSGVPAQLLKNLFSRESQFWPSSPDAITDVGLGQLTENGADTTLLWNPQFFEQFCPMILENGTCQKGYPFLEEEDQDTLRGALVYSVDATCATCPLGIDLNRADSSIGVFAQTLLANCQQAAYIVSDVSGLPISEVSTYEDMWRFTLVNYNAGPGCLTLALQETMDFGEPLVWGNVMTHLTPVCEGAADYVADISR